MTSPKFASKARQWRYLLAASLLVAASPALADDLRTALVDAYTNNPTLAAARAQQRAQDETVPLARADGLPAANAQATHTEFLKSSANNFTSPERQLSVGVQLSVPIYSGGTVRNAINAAKNRVEAGQASLRGTESSLFSAVVGAYMDVIRDIAIVNLNQQNVQVLDVNLQATSDRFEIGDLTRTDVAQSQARLSIARGNLRTAEANLIRSREIYIQLVGRAPGDLEPPPPLPNLPDAPDMAVDIALANNPDLIAAAEQIEAAEYDVKRAGGSRAPQIDVFTNGSYANFYNTLGGNTAGNFAQDQTTADAGVRITIPIYQGGRPGALVRQAQAQTSAAMEQRIAVERDVIAQTRAAYSSWQAALAVIVSSQEAVDANTLSLEGVRAENSVGNRTILDILNAEQELLNSQVQLITARRNAYVAGFTMLAAMGKAEARDLGLEGGTLYDPNVNYERVRGKWFDWDTGPRPSATSTRTIDTAPQTATIAPVETAPAVVDSSAGQ